MRQTFDARQLAIGWLSAAIASGADELFPVLNRTISIEMFDAGVRFAATDRMLLLHAFVPNTDHDPDDEPPLDIGPEKTAIAFDVNRRGQSMLAFLLALANANEKADPPRPLPQVELELDVIGDEAEPMLDGMEARYVVIDHVGVEMVRLETYVGGEYPSWREVTHTFKPVSTKAIGLNPSVVGRLAKLGKLHDNTPLVWRFGGPDKLALLDVEHYGTPHVFGAVAPIRMRSLSEAAELLRNGKGLITAADVRGGDDE